jgi:L-methionine (R)-S-oxide reductase
MNGFPVHDDRVRAEAGLDGKGGSGETSGRKAGLYEDLAGQIDGLLTGETDFTANLANAAAAIFHALPALNWAGFYLARGGELVLGPFQGKPACVRIPMGKGVCGTAAQRRESVLVPDVHAFPGHIACDAASQSELVVPLVGDDGRLIGVLDLDSPRLARFDANDQAGCEALVAIIVRHLGVARPA